MSPQPHSTPPATGQLRRFHHHAMACDWDFWLYAAEASPVEQAARAAFGEVDRLERELSRFVPSSDIARINAARAHQPILVGIEALECLALAGQVHVQTGGRFDVTIGTWLPRAETRTWEPTEANDAPSGDARPVLTVGMHRLQIDRARRTVTKLANGLIIDLGAIGKGYALDQAAAMLRAWGVQRGLLHCGQSTVLAVGSPPGAPHDALRKPHDPVGPSWSVALRDPVTQSGALGHVSLRDAALSGSGQVLHGAHIVDPLSGAPARTRAAWAVAPTAALSDAFSTAFMLMSPEEIETVCRTIGIAAAFIPADGPLAYFGQMHVSP